MISRELRPCLYLPQLLSIIIAKSTQNVAHKFAPHNWTTITELITYKCYINSTIVISNCTPCCDSQSVL